MHLFHSKEVKSVADPDMTRKKSGSKVWKIAEIFHTFEITFFYTDPYFTDNSDPNRFGSATLEIQVDEKSQVTLLWPWHCSYLCLSCNVYKHNDFNANHFAKTISLNRFIAPI